MIFRFSSGNIPFQWKHTFQWNCAIMYKNIHFKFLKKCNFSEVKLHTMAKLNASGMIGCRIKGKAWCMVSIDSSGNEGV